MAELKKELTTMDLCKMFDVSRQSIFNWRRRGEDSSKVLLEYYKLGGNGLSDPTRYNLETVRKFASDTGRIIVNEIFTTGIRPIPIPQVAANNE